MKKCILFFAILISTVNTTAFAQRFKAKEIPDELKSLAAKCNRTLSACTINTSLFATWTTFGELQMAKGEGRYYLILKYGALPPINFTVDNSFDILFTNGDTIRLFLCKPPANKQVDNSYNINLPSQKNNNWVDYAPKPSIKVQSSTALTYCFYEITEEQVMKLSVNKFDRINLYYSTDALFKNSKFDTAGHKFLEYEIGKKSRFTRMAAECILTI